MSGHGILPAIKWAAPYCERPVFFLAVSSSIDLTHV
jgi:hypothetical protein